MPIKIITKKKIDVIKIKGQSEFKSFNYNIPSDISSASFFIVLTLLANKSNIILKNININESRKGIIKILNMMNSKILIKNKKNHRGEAIGDIIVKSQKNLKGIKCPKKFNSEAIDEFLIIFLVAAKAKGISYFNDIEELNQKESPRLKIASKILKQMGVKNVITKKSIKIYGNPNLTVSKKILIKNFKKDHRVFMMSVIAALIFGGNWTIHNPDSIRTSFPSFLKKIKFLGGKFR
jgi:3-phosphoshikimate 1-carboxyvinyltransferase